MLPDEKEGRPGDYTETADHKTSHDQATSATDSSGGGQERSPENCAQQQHKDAEAKLADVLADAVAHSEREAATESPLNGPTRTRMTA